MFLLFRLHRKYVLCKTNFIIFSFMLVLVAMAFFISVQPFASSALQDLNREGNAIVYQANMQMISKLVLILFACYLFGNSFGRSNDSYNVFFLSGEQDRIKYFISKWLTLAFIYVASSLICLCIYVLFGYLYTTWFHFELSIGKYLLYIMAEGLIYGSLACFFSLLLNNAFSFLIPYLLFMISEIINEQKDDNLLFRVYNFIFPSIIISQDTIRFIFGIYHALLVLLSLIVISSLLFLIRDLS